MIFTANNGIRFRSDKRRAFIGGDNIKNYDYVTVWFDNNLAIDFLNGDYLESYIFPF